MATDLKDDATHEDIQQVVDQIVEDRKSDEPEEKGDAQKIAEERDEPTTQIETPAAETDSDSEDSEDTADTGEETGADWLDDDLKAEVAAYGIDEKELADFTSREELDRALRFFDKSVLESGRKALADTAKAEGEQEESKTRYEGKLVKKEPEPESKDGQVDGDEIKLSDIWDDDAKTELESQLNKIRGHYESRIDAIESRFKEMDAAIVEAETFAEEQQFDRVIDSLGHADLFGKSGKETPKQLERRQAVFEDWTIRKSGFERHGRKVEMSESIIRRAARSVFSDEFDKKIIKAHTTKISKQANSRGGDSATKGASPVESLREEMRRRYKEQEAG